MDKLNEMLKSVYTNAETCSECGGTIGIGDWPFCNGDPSKHVPAENFGLDPLEPYVDSNILDRKDPRCTYRDSKGAPGILIETRSDRRKLMRELGLQYGSAHPGGREV